MLRMRRIPWAVLLLLLGLAVPDQAWAKGSSNWGFFQPIADFFNSLGNLGNMFSGGGGGDGGGNNGGGSNGGGSNRGGGNGWGGNGGGNSEGWGGPGGQPQGPGPGTGGPSQGNRSVCMDSITCLKGGNQNPELTGGSHDIPMIDGMTQAKWDAMTPTQQNLFRQQALAQANALQGQLLSANGSASSPDANQYGLNIPGVGPAHDTGANLKNIGDGVAPQSLAPYVAPAQQPSGAGSGSGPSSGGASDPGPANAVGPGWAPTPGGAIVSGAGANASGAGKVGGPVNWAMNPIPSAGAGRYQEESGVSPQDPSGAAPRDSGGSIPPVMRTFYAQQDETFTRTVRYGQTYLGIGDFRGALLQAQRAMELRPEDPEGYQIKFEALRRLGMLEEAGRVASKLARLQPGADAHKKAAWAFLGAGRLSDALQEVEEAMRLGGGAEALVLRAGIYRAEGDLVRMMQDLEDAARLDKNFAPFLDKARRGEPFFDPKDSDNYGLLAGMRRRSGGRPWLGLAMLLSILAALGSAAAAARRRFSPAARRARHARALNESVFGQQGGAIPDSGPASGGSSPWQEGLLAGKYQMARILGSGSSGQVWEAKDLRLDRTVAIKRAPMPEGAQARAALLARARTIAGLHHPGIVDIHEVLEHPTGLYLVFQHLSGETLKQALLRRRRLPCREALQALKAACAALAYAHVRGVHHGNLKPSNLMLGSQGGAKLMDFGLAEPGAGAAGDVHQLGALLYESLCGEQPFAAAAPFSAGARSFIPVSLRVPVPAAVDELLGACLSEKPEERPRDAKALLASLEAMPEPASVT